MIRFEQLVLVCVVGSAVAAQGKGQAAEEEGQRERVSAVVTDLYWGRSEERKDEWKSKGGRIQVEAIERGLEWLSRQQEENGSWRALTAKTNDIAVTAASLLAFLGNGDTPTVGEYRDRVARGIQWLLKQQDASGEIGSGEEPGGCLGHSIAMCALIESLSKRTNVALVEKVRLGVEWAESKGMDDDWTALASALVRRFGGIAIPRSRRTLGTVGRTRGGDILVAYLLLREQKPNIPNEWVESAVKELDSDVEPARFFAACGLYQIGEKTWRRAQVGLLSLANAQARDRELDGSWKPRDAESCRRFETALNIMTLQAGLPRYGRVLVGD